MQKNNTKTVFLSINRNNVSSSNFRNKEDARFTTKYESRQS